MKNEKKKAENIKLFGRLCEAARYQELAVKALFPERMAGHLEVIGRELKAMVMESVEEGIKKKEDGASSTKVNKVDIE